MTSTQDVTTEAVVEPQVDGQEQQVDSRDENIRNMREIIKANHQLIARQNQQLEEINARFNSMQQQTPQPEPEEDYFQGMDDEDALEVKQVKKVLPKEVERAVKKALDADKKQKSLAEQKAFEAINASKEKYDDFDEVMAKDNIDSIITNVPAVYRLVQNSPDPIEAAYHLIKNSAAYERKKTSKAQNMVEKAKLQENQSKPKSPNSVAPTQSTVANVNVEAGTFSRLTKSQQKELWTEHNRKLGRRV
jgi:hypothetical protein